MYNNRYEIIPQWKHRRCVTNLILNNSEKIEKMMEDKKFAISLFNNEDEK
jgi:hypothetical protein